MANMKKCDRCGAVYPYSITTDPNAIRLIKVNTINNIVYDGQTLDLCPDCMDKLMQFLDDVLLGEPARQKVENAYNALLQDTPDIDAATGYLGEVLDS